VFPGVQPRICHHFRDISSQNFDFSSFDLDRATPEPKVTKLGDDVPSTLVYHTQKNFRPIAQTMYEICYQSFSLIGFWGLTPRPKFTKRGEDLAESEIYQPAKFHRSMPTHARVVRIGVYPHMPIAVTTNSLQHWSSPSKRRPICHTVRDGRASLLHRANHRQMCYRCLNF